MSVIWITVVLVVVRGRLFRKSAVNASVSGSRHRRIFVDSVEIIYNPYDRGHIVVVLRGNDVVVVFLKLVPREAARRWRRMLTVEDCGAFDRTKEDK
jgi:hypothetical protein